MRRFVLDRKRDVTGISGPGIVAEGVSFSDGSVAMRWLTETGSTEFWGSIEDCEQIHGHQGATVVQWLDPTWDTEPIGVGELGDADVYGSDDCALGKDRWEILRDGDEVPRVVAKNKESKEEK